ncbi:MAG: nickel-dependent lactate racemase [bacterium]|nr:nickel-dependent lactate racemase [bacterium]MDT8367222.1 nickel-dependent lactate racemase [bacterium]
MYSLPYGRSSIEIPDLWNKGATVLSPGPFPVPNPEKTVTHALDHPLGNVTLQDLCSPGDRIACVIPDLTRRASVSQYLPLLLQKLSEIGVNPKDVIIIVALGIHRPLTDTELSELVGEKVRDKYRIVNHDPDDKRSNIFLGTTDTGIPVEINEEVAKADRVILTGGITYHYFAGYGGGRKSLLPGVASRKACEAHHKLVVSWRRGELRGELAPGVLMENPVHRQMLQACTFIPPIFILNVVTEPGGMIVAASAGELEAAHMDACRKHDSWFRKELQARSRLVIAGSGGYPRDVNFVQAHKGLFAAHQAVAGDGVVLLAADCAEGTGHPDLLDWFDRCHSQCKWQDELEARYQINGQTAFSTWLRVTSVPTVLVSRLNGSDVERMGIIPADNMEEALKAAREILGELPVPVIIPDAGDVLPVVGSAECKV